METLSFRRDLVMRLALGSDCETCPQVLVLRVKRCHLDKLQRRRFVSESIVHWSEIVKQLSSALCLCAQHVAYTHDIPFPLWQPLPCFVVAPLFSYQDARASGDSALSFPLRAEWLATTVHRLGVDASDSSLIPTQLVTGCSLVDPSLEFFVREEDATSFELVATPRIDVAAGSSRG
ncbi:transcription initiation factor [Dorcoceras hygrometricum]|uniref:Transcription initiation factor n=1 Tax=Dorcoceras hygrometricum TaxID=472368 RepID=A0A2Z7DFI6_9LAMI|nr:transcription initiation factor [Dorcoceras hygrometricum]